MNQRTLLSTNTPTASTLTTIKITLFVLGLTPLLSLVWQGYVDALGANPIEFVTRALGDWTLNFLLITLTVSPLRKLSGWHWLIKLRRMLGLFAFFYAVLHLTTYVWLDQFFDWQEIGKDILKRPFITAGMSAFVLLLPLAVTSTQAMIRRIGGKNWQQIHRFIYVIAILGVLHYWWLVKLDTSEPRLYAWILAFLLGIRLVWWRQRHSKRD